MACGTAPIVGAPRTLLLLDAGMVPSVQRVCVDSLGSGGLEVEYSPNSEIYLEKKRKDDEIRRLKKQKLFRPSRRDSWHSRRHLQVPHMVLRCSRVHPSY